MPKSSMPSWAPIALIAMRSCVEEALASNSRLSVTSSQSRLDRFGCRPRCVRVALGSLPCKAAAARG